MPARAPRSPVDETVTIGHLCIGRIKEMPRGFICSDANGNGLGAEQTVKAARKLLYSRHQAAGEAA